MLIVYGYEHKIILNCFIILMKEIFFICSWEKSNKLINKLKRNTPNNKGIWKNIKIASNFQSCDYMIVIDDLYIDILNLGINNFNRIIKNYDKIIYFQRENTMILNMKKKKSWFILNILPKLKHKYIYEDNYFYTFTTASFINKSYDELKNMRYPEKKKKLSCIISNKNLSIEYTQRINFITEFSKNNPNLIDIYGKGWNKELGDNYKGELGCYHNSISITSKANGLQKYNYSICLENYPDDKIISEKITDCLLMWCMPIYYGSSFTKKYFPKDSFHLIDIKNKDINNEIYNIIKKPIEKKNIIAIEKARNLILNKYNIWEQIYQIIDNNENYKINYRFNLD